jgi:hypothetical protein
MKFNHESSLLAVATTDNLLRLLRLPISKHRPSSSSSSLGTTTSTSSTTNSPTYFGHESGLTSVSFNSTSSLLLSSSSDKSARLFQVSKCGGEAEIAFTHIHGSSSHHGGGGGSRSRSLSQAAAASSHKNNRSSSNEGRNEAEVFISR